MAHNKLSLIPFKKYLELDKCFKNKFRQYYIEDLMERISNLLENNGYTKGASRSSIYNDIKFMKSIDGFNAPIIAINDGCGRKYYRYSDTNFSIVNQPLNPQDIIQLKSIVEYLSRFSGLVDFGWINEISARFSEELQLTENTPKVISFDENKNLKGLSHLPKLYNSIVEHKALNIRHYSYNTRKTYDRILSPYYLKQYNKRWFLFGYDSDTGTLQNIPLDRIDEVEELTKYEYVPNTFIDYEYFFDNIIGVTKEEGLHIEEVVLKIDDSLWQWIESKPIHASQKEIERDNSSVTIKLLVIPNYELESNILSFGEKITVLKPESLRKKICERAKSICSNY